MEFLYLTEVCLDSCQLIWDLCKYFLSSKCYHEIILTWSVAYSKTKYFGTVKGWWGWKDISLWWCHNIDMSMWTKCINLAANKTVWPCTHSNLQYLDECLCIVYPSSYPSMTICYTLYRLQFVMIAFIYSSSHSWHNLLTRLQHNSHLLF